MLQINKLHTICIVGVGLLGGSIGLAIRAAGSGARRIGVGRRQSSLDKALEYDAVDEVTLDMAVGVREAELVIVCTPIGTIAAMFEQMAGHLPKGCLVTDVGSTKAGIVQLAHRILPKHVRFVGSHPIAGSEKTSVEFARADLFQNAACLLTPTRRTDEGARQDVEAFWQALGAHTHVLTPRRHDHVMAQVSHLPHAMAAALVRLAGHGNAIQFAGQGFGDTTRIASGSPELWRDIFKSNREATLQSLERLTRELERFRQLVTRGDGDGLAAWLEQAKTQRDAWVRQRYAQKEVEP